MSESCTGNKKLGSEIFLFLAHPLHNTSFVGFSVAVPEGGCTITEKAYSRFVSYILTSSQLQVQGHQEGSMALHFSDELLKTADPNGGIYGDWILKKDSFNITCKFCKSNVCLKEGEKALSKHSATQKHRTSKTAADCHGSEYRTCIRCSETEEH